MNNQNKELLLMHLLSPMHVGGNYEFSVVDQPIQREGHTGFPKIEASSLKGSIRHHFARKGNTAQNELEEQIFGKTDHAGDLIFTDARLLFFPMRSAKGVYALITCPLIMKQFNKEKIDMPPLTLTESTTNLITKNSQILFKDSKVILDEFVFENVEKDDSFTRWVEKIESLMTRKNRSVSIQPHAMLVSDDDFAYFVKHSTEIITRTAIDPQTGTVTEGALFDEEYVPAEAIFYSIVYSRQHTLQELELDVLQIGGNMTLGKGFVQTYPNRRSSK